MTNTIFFCFFFRFKYVNFCFTKYAVNTICNTVKTVLQNIFDGMVFVAFKLDAVVQTIKHAFKDSTPMHEVVLKCIQYIIETYSRKLVYFIEKNKGFHNKHMLNFDTIRVIIIKAFYVLMHRRYCFYENVIIKLKEKLKRLKFIQTKTNVKYFSKLPNSFKNIQMHKSLKRL